MLTPNFADRLIQAIVEKQTPLVVGLDPRYEQIPFVEPTGHPSASDKASAYVKFSIEVIDAVADLVPAVKPQAAFFEALGPAGMVALHNVVRYAQSKGLLVIMDAKRGDIGSTAEAYASAYLNRASADGWQCDALTVNPYLGDDSLTPFVDVAVAHQTGVFVLVRTSNPGSRVFQEWPSQERPLYGEVAEWVQNQAHATLGEKGYGAIGAVIGATHPEQLAKLREQMPNTWFLVPGLGAQGGTAADIAGAFDERGWGGLINSSRAIIFAHANPEFAAENWQDSVAKATAATIQSIAEGTSAGQLRQ